ncbi:unnamed protein product [marine sediment metagenome]|uniref:Ribbon-helix-helix protein CopG domain-containing protein n=1 Tax=marine sediment metagenome TaxID=412755 RepID=X1AWQ1_9ZZZZ
MAKKTLYDLQKETQQKYNKKNTPITIRFDAGLLEDLRARADEKGVSLSHYIRDLVINHQATLKAAYDRGVEYGVKLSDIESSIQEIQKKK